MCCGWSISDGKASFPPPYPHNPPSSHPSSPRRAAVMLNSRSPPHYLSSNTPLPSSISLIDFSSGGCHPGDPIPPGGLIPSLKSPFYGHVSVFTAGVVTAIFSNINQWGAEAGYAWWVLDGLFLTLNVHTGHLTSKLLPKLERGDFHIDCLKNMKKCN